MNTAIMKKTPAIAIGIQAGARTHHHDQSITLQSLSVTKRRSSRLPKPIPVDEDDSLDMTDGFKNYELSIHRQK
jgi:hypothetical protein